MPDHDNDKVQRRARWTAWIHNWFSNKLVTLIIYIIYEQSQLYTSQRGGTSKGETERDKNRKRAYVCVREKKKNFRRLILIVFIGCHLSLFIEASPLSFFNICHYRWIIILIIIVIIIVSLYIYTYIYIVQNVITTNPRLDNSHSNFLYTHSPRQKKNTMIFKRLDWYYLFIPMTKQKDNHRTSSECRTTKIRHTFSDTKEDKNSSTFKYLHLNSNDYKKIYIDLLLLK